MNNTNKIWVLSCASGLIAAVIYFSSVADYAFPGIGAQLMAIWKGLEPSSGVNFPLMSVFARAFGSGNLIAPVCGALSAAFFFVLVAAFIGWRVENEKMVHERHRISLIAALTATGVFVFTPAVWSSATHIEPRLFDFTWALLSFALALPFFGRLKNFSWLYPILFGALVACGICDTALFVAFAPFEFMLVWALARRTGRNPLAALFLFLLSFALSLIVAVNCFDITVVEVFRQTAQELSLYKSTRGWLFVLLFTTLPFVIALFSSEKAFSEKPGLVQWLFHGAMSFVVILSVATPLSPSSLMEPYGILPVATSAFAAAVAGYLVAYWWVNRRNAVGLVGGSILTFVLTVNACFSLFVFDGQAGAFADKIARRIVADLGSRRWFVTDGLLDNHLMLVASEMDKPLNLICLAKDLDKEYLERFDALLEKEGVGGSKNAALRLSLSLGVLPFVQDWFASDPSVVKDVAIFGAPDLWYTAGLTPVPELLFFGADKSITPDWSAWKELDVILKAPKGWGSYRERKVTNPIDRLRFSLRRHVGFVANNRGVYLQDEKRDDEAFAMYELVLGEIDHDNICAIFNEVGMVGQKHAQAMAKRRELERMLKTAVEDKNRRYLLWRLSTYYGYIRNPDTFIRTGYAWARSGRAGDALSHIRRAIDFVPSDKKSILLNMMAALYASENDQQKSRDLYASVLEKNKDDHDALIGMMRLELKAGNTTKALEYLQRAVDSETDKKRTNIEKAMLEMMKGDLAKAKVLLKKMTNEEKKNMQAWSLLATVTMQQIDACKNEKEKAALIKELEEEIVPSMERQSKDQFDYHVQMTKGFLLLRKGEVKRREARDAFVTAAKARPDVETMHDLVLGLDISLNDKEHAEKQAREVLRRNRKAPLANYVMGSLALGNNKYAEAEAYLRTAANAPQPVVLAMNDLAEVLRRNKNFAEAERYARLATEKEPEFYIAWETLGAILMDSERNLDEAEACIRKACQLSKDKDGKDADIRMLVSLARVQVRRADMEHAKVTIRKVRSRIKELSEFEKREFEEVVKGVR